MPRLDALRAAFPNRSLEARIDGPWSDAVLFAELPGGIPNPCVYRRLEDVDPMPGIQPDCLAAEGATGDGPVIPPCTMVDAERPDPSTTLPCYWIRAQRDPVCGDEAIVEYADPPAFGERPPPARLHCPCALTPRRGEG
jgi:hypothetical protein